MDIHKSLAEHLRADTTLQGLIATPASQIGYAFDPAVALPQIAIAEAQRALAGPVKGYLIRFEIRAAGNKQDTVSLIRNRLAELFHDQWNYVLSSGDTALNITWSEGRATGEGIDKEDAADYFGYADEYEFAI